MGGSVMSRMIIVGSGLLYPGYSSYKAVSKADVRQYVRWMMYWIVFAVFSTIEVFTDVFLSWVPFYYELKVLFVFWLVVPYFKGSTFLYKKFIHPNLSKKEQEIDSFLENARERSYQTMVDVGSKGINMAASAVVTAAVKGQSVVTNRLRSYSVTDLSRIQEAPANRHQLARRMTCQPILSGAPLQSAQASTSANPTSRVRAEYAKPYSMLNIVGKVARDVPTGAAEVAPAQTATFTVDDMRITTRRGAEPIPEELGQQYYTMPRTRGGSRNRELSPLPPTSEARS